MAAATDHVREGGRPLNRLKIIPMIALLFWPSSVTSGQDGYPGYSTGERRFVEGIVSTLPNITGAELRYRERCQRALLQL
jgi:hypothetical protein